MIAYNSYSDLELLSLLSKDNVQAFDTIYSRYAEELYKSAFFVLKDSGACKDIVQDIFVWIWQHRKDLEIHFLKSYLKSAVKFKVANYIRSGNIRESFFEQFSNYNNTASPATSAELAETNDLNTIILQAISRLPEKCRNIFRLSRENHLTNQQIAGQLGISVKTVETQMTIALSRIRAAVQPYLATLLLIIISCNL